MSAVTIYIEGGGRRQLDSKCRKGFSAFFRRAGLSGDLPKVVAGGPRNGAYDKFRRALRSPEGDSFSILLVDSEGAVDAGTQPWAHLRARDRWEQPNGASDDQAHLMVQCMEAWFLADKAAVADYFGAGFASRSLPAGDDVETVPKQDIERGLDRATRGCKKGRYDKGRHSFDLLAALDPEMVSDASPHAKRLLVTLRARSTS